jgi:flagellar basal body-associated protein FliL
MTPAAASNSASNPFTPAPTTTSPTSTPSAFGTPTATPVAGDTTTALNTNEKIIAGATDPATRKPKKNLVLIIVAIIVVILIVAGLLVYFLWYQNKDKVVLDAVSGAISSKEMTMTGTMTIKASNMTMSLDLSGGNNGGDGTADVAAKISYGSGSANANLSLKASTVLADGTLYIKLDGIKDALSGLGLGAVLGGGSSALTSLDGEWISISPDDLDSLSSGAGKTMTCLTDGIAKAATDSSFRSEMVKAYTANPAFTVGDKVGSESGSIGYKVTINSSNLTSYENAAKNTTVYKNIYGCLPASVTSQYSTDSVATDFKGSAEIWATTMGHKLTKIVLNDSESSDGTTETVNLTLKPTLGVAANVKKPTGAKSFKDVAKELQKMTTEMMSGGIDSESTSS